MTSTFTALPLPSGEAFILETDHDGRPWVILVDGGQSTKVGPEENSLYTSIVENCPGVTDRIDVAICTHRDHDHAGGFPAFIRTWLAEGKAIGEFWLPGGWAGAVHDALTNPDQLVSTLHQGALHAAALVAGKRHELEAEGLALTDIAAKVEMLHSIYEILHLVRREHLSPSLEGETQANPDSEPLGPAYSWGFEEDSWKALASNLDSSELHARSLRERAEPYTRLAWDTIVLSSDSVLRGHHHEIFQHMHESPAGLARSLFLSVIDTAEAIRDIAASAVHFDIPVRWFDFGEFENGVKPSGGIDSFLQPLNSVELRRATKEPNPLILYLKLTLTEQNVASLVFQRCETEQEPAVILLGDSRLAFGIDRPTTDFDQHMAQISRPIIFTAPHHGSRNNDRAYVVLRRWLGAHFKASTAVRNGGVWNQTLEGYLDLEYRRCAQCHQCHGGTWSQLVRIRSNANRWSLRSDQGKKCGVPRRRVGMLTAGAQARLPTVAERVKRALEIQPGLTQANLATHIFGKSGYPQRVGPACRRLVANHEIEQRGSGGARDPITYFLPTVGRSSSV